MKAAVLTARDVVLLSCSISALALASCASTQDGPGDDPAEGRGTSQSPSGTSSQAGLALGPGPISEPAVLDASYAIRTAYASDVRVNGVAAGDLDPDSPGDEIVAVDRLGRVHVITNPGGEPTHQMIAATGGELVQVAVGNLLAEAPGDEIVAVGAYSGTEDDDGPGVVRVFYRDGAGDWQGIDYVAPALVHGVAVGPLSHSNSTGPESFVCAGFFHQALVGNVYPAKDGSGVGMGVGALDLPRVGNVKGVAMTTAGFVLACDDGQSVQFTSGPKGFRPGVPIEHGSALARVSYDAEMGLLLADNDGFLRIVSPDTASSTTVLERSKQRLRGALFVDIDPSNAGLEACSAGYDGRIRVVRLNRVEKKELDLPGQPVTMGWSGEVRYVVRDSAKLHHLATGDIAGVGTCLISCGYSGDVLLIHRQDG